MNARVPLILMVAVAALCLNTGGAIGAEVTHPDRESTYPPGVTNVTHAPWQPAAGDDIAVTLRLTPDAEVPARVSLIYCRVEPQYVCGAPQLLEQDDNGDTWKTTIAWDERFMRPETVHLGYNLTMRFLEPDGSVRKVAAPTGNHWLPATYPEEADGTYYFVRYGESDGGMLGLDVPAPAVVPSLVAITAAAAILHGRIGGNRRG